MVKNIDEDFPHSFTLEAKHINTSYMLKQVPSFCFQLQRDVGLSCVILSFSAFVSNQHKIVYNFVYNAHL